MWSQGVLEVLFFEPLTQLMIDELAPPQPSNVVSTGALPPGLQLPGGEGAVVAVGTPARQALSPEMGDLLGRVQE